jgi:hypothetical protein
LTVPKLDSRTYQDLFSEAVARIPASTPEWTNLNQSDPGITILGLMAFLTESVLYRANQIPDRNRLKFLSLLGVPLSPATAANALVALSNDKGPLHVFSLTPDLEVKAGNVSFRTTDGLDVLPIELRVYFKQKTDTLDQATQNQYLQLYTALLNPTAQPAATPGFYSPALLGPGGASQVDLNNDTVDGSAWLAILARSVDASDMDAVRTAIGGKTLTLGLVPITDPAGVELGPTQLTTTNLSSVLAFWMPYVTGPLPPTRVPTYRRLDATPSGDVLHQPGIVEIVLPPAAELTLWNDLQPTESGSGAFPPSLDDTNLSDRVITWIRIQTISPTDASFMWIGANAMTATQLTHVSGEILPDGTGDPDQSVTLTHAPFLPESVLLTVTPPSGDTQTWRAIEDLMAAGPEVPAADPRLPPGSSTPLNLPTQVFVEDPEAGTLTFGDGIHGQRPAAGAQMRVNYDYSNGSGGNVSAGAINIGPSLPPGMTVTNPISTWGGADAESVSDGTKQITRYLQHRDRLVTKADFQAITLRTPGVSIGRAEVLPAFHPVLSPNIPGDAAGAVTLLVLPSYDPDHPGAPEPSQDFLNAIAAYLEPRRLVTTELFLRGATYVDIWIALGIGVVPGASVHDVILAVKAAIQQFLSPLPPPGTPALPDTTTVADAPSPSMLQVDNGWPLGKSVVALEALAVASRVNGVLLVNGITLTSDAVAGASMDQVSIAGLQLPRLKGISVTTGDPVDIKDLIGSQPVPTASPQGGPMLPIPVVPEEC